MNIRQITLFSAIILAGIIIFQILSPVLSKPAADIYGSLTQPVFRILTDSDKRIIENETEKLPNQGYFRIKIKIGNIEFVAPDGRILSKVQRANVRTFVLIPIFLIIIFFLATPLNFRKRLHYAVIGAILANLFIFFKFIIFFLSGEQGKFETVELSSGVQSVINLFSGLLITETEMGTTVFVVIVLWLSIVFLSGSIPELKKKVFPKL